MSIPTTTDAHAARTTAARPPVTPPAQTEATPYEVDADGETLAHCAQRTQAERIAHALGGTVHIHDAFGRRIQLNA